jgi:hypothetical protein
MMLFSQLGELRKDTGAIASRLGVLEEKCANLQQAHDEMVGWLSKFSERVAASDLGRILKQLDCRNLEQLDSRTACGIPFRPGDRVAMGQSVAFVKPPVFFSP